LERTSVLFGSAEEGLIVRELAAQRVELIEIFTVDGKEDLSRCFEELNEAWSADLKVGQRRGRLFQPTSFNKSFLPGCGSISLWSRLYSWSQG